MAGTAAQRLAFAPRDGLELSVEFRRVGDRYAHAIVIEQGNQLVQRWDSVEGTNQDLWPPSPALQQLNIQPIAGGRDAALLVGMAGKSHFSLSVTVEPVSQQIVFDAACNYKLQPAFLGSSYRVTIPNAEFDRIDVQFEADLPTRFQRDHASDSVRFLPAAELAAAPALGRWCYRISLRKR